MNDLKTKIGGRFPIFEPALLDEMTEKAQIKEAIPGEIIMRKGQYFKSAMLLLEGLVKIYREDDDGNEFFMYYLEPGAACALSLLCSQKQETSEITAKADSAAQLLTIPLTLIDQWMTKYPSWNRFALNNYRERFEELLQTIDHIAFRHMDERLVFYLKKHQEKLKSNIVPVSITTMAQELNSSREVISRLLRKLSDKGLVRFNKSTLEIVDLERALL